MMNLVKLRFLRDGKPQGHEYSYISKVKDRLKEIIAKAEEK